MTQRELLIAIGIAGSGCTIVLALAEIYVLRLLSQTYRRERTLGDVIVFLILLGVYAFCVVASGLLIVMLLLIT